MKRDIELIRAILIDAEKAPIGGGPVSVPGYSEEELYYNAQLARDHGLMNAKFLPNSTQFHVISLTYEGHQFLDAARSDTVWNRAKEKVIKATGTLTLEALKIALRQLIGGGGQQ